MARFFVLKHTKLSGVVYHKGDVITDDRFPKDRQRELLGRGVIAPAPDLPPEAPVSHAETPKKAGGNLSVEPKKEPASVSAKPRRSKSRKAPAKE